MSMVDFFLAALSLAPIGLLLLFWRVFPGDRSVHPIYRESDVEATEKGTDSQDATARRLHVKDIERNGQKAA